tara:strand:+ start:1619 stop:3214 length:1596 start_codon:yes stop_codon:yes gene_type:complete
MERILFFILILLIAGAKAQITAPGFPASSLEKKIVRTPVIIITPPAQTNQKEGIKQPLLAAIILDTDINYMQQAHLTVLENGDKIYRLAITSKDAKALNVLYDDFNIPEGGKLFIYDPSKTQLHGAYTSINNSINKNFTHDYITGDQLVIEYNEPANVTETKIHINQIGYFLRDGEETSLSAECEVNINCPEGDNWQDEKKGVVRLLIKNGNQIFWCSGSLVNNTGLDCAPYVLSAEHCTNGTNQQDNDASIVYFGYECSSCAGTSGDATKTMVGFNIVAKATGSDFILLRLKTEIPDNYEPYFNGWKKDDATFGSGVSIHHPDSDVKKISTYSTNLFSTSIPLGITNGYWGVIWSSTSNGHGITEGGSSGSPIFNKDGLIIGTLTGGNSFCSTPTETDYYGKLSAHWDQNGSIPSKRLLDFLDPSGAGSSELKGTYKPCTNSVSELTFDEIKVWPNPSSTMLNIKIEHTNFIKPTIILNDLMGKVIFKQQLSTSNNFLIKIPTSKFSNGNYILSISTPSISTHQSIIIAR